MQFADAGDADAGLNDAGLSDAGLSDAGLSDAGALDGGADDDEIASAHAAIQDAVDAAPFDDVALVIGNASGTLFAFTKGAFTTSTVVPTDSAQKWVVATVLLREARAAGIGLDTPLSAYPSPFVFTAPTADGRDQATLRQLLSFSSGFENNAFCATLAGGQSQSACASTIANDTSASGFVVPRRFRYGTYHMLLASAALALNDLDDAHYQSQFAQFADETGLFGASSYQQPLVGEGEKPTGFMSTADDYAAFLVAQLNGTLLHVDDQAEMFTAQTAGLDVVSSPADVGEMEGTWLYGLGNWVRCDDGQPCDSMRHSAGARGWLPWIDLDNQTFGVWVASRSAGAYADSVVVYNEIREHVATLCAAP